jgi:hypothetical protein
VTYCYLFFSAHSVAQYSVQCSEHTTLHDLITFGAS